MIEIRLDQVQVFHEKVRATYVKRVRSYLRKQRAPWIAPLTEEELDSLIRRQIIAAESFGIISETGAVRFIEVGLALGEDFFTSGRHPDAERILLQQGLDTETKLQKLEALATTCGTQAP